MSTGVIDRIYPITTLYGEAERPPLDVEENLEKDELPTDIELVIAAVNQREMLGGPYDQTLSDISDLRAQIELITTVLVARGYEPTPNDYQTYRDDYVSHYEVWNKLLELHIDFDQADIKPDDHKLIDETYAGAATRSERIRYSPDNPQFQEWLAANHPQDSLDYIRMLADQTRIRSDDEDAWWRVNKEADWGVFQRLYEEWWNSPESIAAAYAVPDAFQRLDLKPEDSATFEGLRNRRAELAQETRNLLRHVLPDLKIVFTEIEKIEQELREDYGITDIPAAVIEYTVDLSPRSVTEETLRTDTIDTVESDEAMHAYLRLSRELLKQKQAEERRLDLAGTALRSVA